MAITTTIAANQAWQRGRSTLTLAGTYDLSGDPTSIAWRVGSGDWVRLTGETIGSGNWSGTLAIPSGYLAQGTLEVKPTNGLNVTPATRSGITVSDVFAILGDSMTGGVSDAADDYTGTFVWREWNGTSWAAVTSQTSIWPELANQIDAAGIPPVFVRYGASGSAFRPDLGGSPGGSWEHPDNTAVGNTDFYYGTGLTRLNGANTGGWKALIWEQGPNDVIDGNTFYEQNLKDLIDNYQAQADDFAGTKMMISLVGEVLSETTNLEALRDAQLSAINTDADILRGPSWLDLDFGDDVHFGKDGPGVAQQAIGGQRWWRAIQTQFYGGGAPLTGPTITSVTITGVREITVTFDRAVANHTDATGWGVVDNSGAVAISSAAQGATTAQVVLTVGADLRTNSGGAEAVLVSFGKFSTAAGATLSDTETIAYPPEREIDYDAGEAYPFLEVAPVMDGTPDGSTTITADTGTWQSTTTLSYAYQWLDGPGGTPIPGATSASLANAPTGAVCQVTATNTAGSTSAETSAGYTPAQAFTGGLQGGWWPIEDTAALWQDTAASTAVSVDADPVARIDDGSGNSNNMLQADTALRLTFDTDDTYQNVTGDGAADGLLTSTFAADGDILMVVAADFSAATGTILALANNNQLAEYIYIEHDSIRHPSNDFNGNTSFAIAPTGRAVVTVVATEADMSFRGYVNGALVGTGTKTGTEWFDTTNTNKIAALARRTATNFPDYNSGAIYGATIVVGANVTALRSDLETYYANLIGVSL